VPELPEIEVLRRQIEKEYVGKRVRSVEVKNTKVLKRHSAAKDFKGRLIGAKVKGVNRKGKYVIIELDNKYFLVFHLGMAGHLIKAATRRPLDKHTHIIIPFNQGGELRYFDARQFGECFIADQAELEKHLGHLGLDAIADQLPWQLFGEMVAERQTKLKPLLMDQKFIAGLGNIYSDEVLFWAGLPWDRPSNSLTSNEVRRLSRAVGEVLQDAIRHRGTTLEDEEWRDLYDDPGEHQQMLAVYAREGLPCRRCRTPVKRVRVGGRSHFFCPQCQSSGEAESA
jgi:formamidopyrimidine-DNA glycosylase